MSNKHKLKITGYLIVGILVLLAIVPATRYVVPSLFVKKNMQVVINDPQGRPAARAQVVIRQHIYEADEYGVLFLKNIPVGHHDIKASSTFYETSQHDIHIPLFAAPKLQTIVLTPTGKITQVQIKNRISGRGLGGIKISSQTAGNGVTNDDGIAIVSLQKNVDEATVTISGDTINEQTVRVRANGTASDNTFFVIPKGRIVYINNSGKLQVITSNLDGSNEQVLLDGTGNEDVSDTQLLAAPSYKFAALKSRRDITPALYILDIESSQVATIENAGQNYIPIGWRGDVFVYLVYSKLSTWLPNSYVLKAYNALNKQTTTIDSSRAEGGSVLDYASEIFENIYLMPEGIVYAKRWQASYYYGARLADKRMTITAADELGNKTVVSEWQAGYNATVKTKQVAPKELAVFIELDGVKRSYYRYEDKQVLQYTETSEDIFKDPAITNYATAPNSLFSSWYDSKKSANFVATIKNTAAAQLDLPSSYKVVGWYGNDYILILDTVSNELKITSRDSAQKSGNTLRIATIYVAPQSATAVGYGR